MKILFVFTDSTWLAGDEVHDRRLVGIHHGISILSSVLKNHGHQTKLEFASVNFNQKAIRKSIQDFTPQLICFTSVSRELALNYEIARFIKSAFPDIYLVLGGSHVTINPKDCPMHPFDAFCIGEGEAAIVELVNMLEDGQRPIKDIRNLMIGNNGNYTPPRPFVEDLDRIPFADREIWEEILPEKYRYKRVRTSILIGRGCAFNCTYCSNHILKKVARGKYLRHRSPANIIAEMEGLAALYPNLKYLFMEVEALNLNLSFMEDLCGELDRFNARHNNKFSFGTNIRVLFNQDFDHIFSVFRKCNLNRCWCGVESGSKTIREQVLGRTDRLDDIYQAVIAAKKHDINLGLNFLMGVPGETKEDFDETIRFAKKCNPKTLQLNVYVPYPGTDLYEKAKREGLLDENKSDFSRCRVNLDLPGFSKEEIEDKYLEFLAQTLSRRYLPVVPITPLKYLSKFLLNRYEKRLLLLNEKDFFKSP